MEDIMLKGVNKQIIEVNNPNSIYFERAVFYLRPGVKKLPAEVSRREIERCISITQSPYDRKKRLFQKLRILTYIALLAVIIALLVIIL